MKIVFGFKHCAVKKIFSIGGVFERSDVSL